MPVDPATTTKPGQLIDAIARTTAAYRYKVWGFGESIAMEGLLAAGGAHRDVARGLIADWARTAGPLRGDPLAHVAPGVPLLELIRESPDSVLWDRALELAHLLANTNQGRCGARIHRPDLPGWEHEVWVDCMHLDGPFFVELGVLSGDEQWTHAAVGQLLGHARVLQNDASGLFSHGFDDASGQPNNVHWGRGQGWALLGLVDTARWLNDQSEGADEIRQRLNGLVSALAATEIESGIWATVVDCPNTFHETSTSAFVSLGVGRAIRRGLVAAAHQPMVDRAWANVQANLTSLGELLHVSGATPVGTTAAHYDTQPSGVYPWGQGAALLAAIERMP
jgi:unsaturated rhamnogalacturonyl hydrolase